MFKQASKGPIWMDEAIINIKSDKLSFVFM